MRARLLVLALLTLLPVVGRAHAGEPRVDETYPALRLPTIERDKTRSVHSFLGSKVLLIQFASW